MTCEWTFAWGNAKLCEQGRSWLKVHVADPAPNWFAGSELSERQKWSLFRYWTHCLLFFCFTLGTGRGRGRGRGGVVSRQRQKIMQKREDRQQEDIRCWADTPPPPPLPPLTTLAAGLWIRIHFCGSGSCGFSQSRSGSNFFFKVEL